MNFVKNSKYGAIFPEARVTSKKALHYPGSELSLSIVRISVSKSYFMLLKPEPESIGVPF
jgi:hypothetical protein